MQKVQYASIMEADLCDVSKNVLVVSGTRSFEESGAKDMIQKRLTGHEVRYCSQFQVNPQLSDLYTILASLQDFSFQTIIAIGGGSVIDMAKLIKAMTYNAADPVAYIQGTQLLESHNPINLIVIPTSSGSGSEATHFAVVYNDTIKYSLAHDSILPNTIIFDVQLTLSLSSYQRACSGFDAFSQAIESYWSPHSSFISQAYAREALELSTSHLLAFVHNEHNVIEHAHGMQKAAYLAGRAINITKTSAPHAFSYYLTSHYGIAHGHAVAVLLALFFEYNAIGNEKVINEICAIIHLSSAYAARSYIESLLQQCHLEHNLHNIINVETQFDEFFASVNQERLQNNPRPVEKDTFRALVCTSALL